MTKYAICFFYTNVEKNSPTTLNVTIQHPKNKVYRLAAVRIEWAFVCSLKYLTSKWALNVTQSALLLLDLTMIRKKNMHYEGMGLNKSVFRDATKIYVMHAYLLVVRLLTITLFLTQHHERTGRTCQNASRHIFSNIYLHNQYAFLYMHYHVCTTCKNQPLLLNVIIV